MFLEVPPCDIIEYDVIGSRLIFEEAAYMGADRCIGYARLDLLAGLGALRAFLDLLVRRCLVEEVMRGLDYAYSSMLYWG